jgi:hypothetical protein
VLILHKSSHDRLVHWMRVRGLGEIDSLDFSNSFLGHMSFFNDIHGDCIAKMVFVIANILRKMYFLS